MSFAKLEHLNLYYEIHGSGETIILISDLLESSQSWQFVINKLSQHFQVILFDNRCVGRSDICISKFNIEDLASDTVGLMDVLKIKKAHIVGHGAGGFIAQEIAIQYPDRVNKLVLEATAPFSNNRQNQLLSNLSSLLDKDTDRELWFRNYYFWIYSTNFLENTEFVDSLIDFNLSYVNPNNIESFKHHANAISAYDSSNRLSEIKAETLIIIGEEDILMMPTDSEKLYQGISMASYPVYLERTGHSIHNENPKKFIHTLLGFFLKYTR
jgi:3-oxoadipate enol-lactonase